VTKRKLTTKIGTLTLALAQQLGSGVLLTEEQLDELYALPHASSSPSAIMLF
jgi:hypothetical protein